MIFKSWQSYCYCLLLIFFSGSSLAVPINATIKNDVLRWVSAQPTVSGLAPAVWATPSKLVPAQVFIPGGPMISSLPLKFTGPDGKGVDLVLELLGMEYNSPEGTAIQPDSSGGAALVSMARGLIVVEGVGLGDSQVTLSKEITPFTHARPIFSLGDSMGIVKIFADANLTHGDYIAQTLLPMTYEYYRSGVRVRHNWSLPLAFVITYEPSVRMEVSLASPSGGVMVPRYTNQHGTQVVSGQALFNGLATGSFPNGLKVMLKAGDKYEMSGLDNTRIPISVTCNGCNQSDLVSEGVLVSNNLTTTGTKIDGINASQLLFSVVVDFSSVDVSSLRTGAYQGRFSMLFEPDM